MATGRALSCGTLAGGAACVRYPNTLLMHFFDRFPLRLLAALLLCSSVAASAGSLSPRDFAAGRPLFDPIRFYTGHTRSWGIFEDRAGAATKRITTETWGRMVGRELVLEQNLNIEGEPQSHRSWRIRRLDAHHFAATASGIIGEARGEAYGNAFQWSFTLAVKPGNPLYQVTMTQRMYLQPDGRTMINRDTVRKFGVLLAEVTEEFRRE